MRQYSIDRVDLSWATIDLKPGLADGTSIQEARLTKSWSMKVTGMGGVIRVYRPGKSGTLTVTLDQESREHRILKAVYDVDEQARNQVFPGIMRDNSTNELFTYRNMFIMSEPDESRGTEAGTVVWEFGFEERKKFIPSTDDNLVGN